MIPKPDYTLDARYPVFEYVYRQKSAKNYNEVPSAEEVLKAFPYFLKIENETGIIGLSTARHKILRKLAINK